MDSTSKIHKNPGALRISIARSLNDLMAVTAIRSAVYLAEQNCPFNEEFDGNDFVGAHFVAYVNDEPVACLRVRFFAGFAKVERLAVRHQFRQSTIAFRLVRTCVRYLRKKGYNKIYGQAQDRLVDFWARFGAKPILRNCKVIFSDFSYTEMLLEMEQDPEAITLDSDPYVLIRPEGDWDRVGILERSAERNAAGPIKCDQQCHSPEMSQDGSFN